jgi:hypothetical protein
LPQFSMRKYGRKCILFYPVRPRALGPLFIAVVVRHCIFARVILQLPGSFFICPGRSLVARVILHMPGYSSYAQAGLQLPGLFFICPGRSSVARVILHMPGPVFSCPGHSSYARAAVHDVGLVIYHEQLIFFFFTYKFASKKTFCQDGIPVWRSGVHQHSHRTYGGR